MDPIQVGDLALFGLLFAALMFMLVEAVGEVRWARVLVYVTASLTAAASLIVFGWALWTQANL